MKTKGRKPPPPIRCGAPWQTNIFYAQERPHISPERGGAPRKAPIYQIVTSFEGLAAFFVVRSALLYCCPSLGDSLSGGNRFQEATLSRNRPRDFGLSTVRSGVNETGPSCSRATHGCLFPDVLDTSVREKSYTVARKPTGATLPEGSPTELLYR